jgi:alpha-L-rhamnosidase
MKRWLDYMKAKYMKDYILTKDKYGDWCVPPESPELIHSKDTLRSTDGHLIATAYYYYYLGLMQRFAKLAGKPADADGYKVLATKINAAFNHLFFNTKTNRYGNNSVTSNLLPLYFGMVPPGKEDKVFDNIIEKIMIDNKGHISTGVIGTQWLMRSLTQHGRADVAYKIASNTDYPSWGYMVDHGATTFWELWNGDTASPQMNSQNHVMLLGDLLVWFYEDLAGIKSAPGHPGFEQLYMEPHPVAGLNDVKASYHSIHGLISSSWKKQNGHFTWSITIPANTAATVCIPVKENGKVREHGLEIKAALGITLVNATAHKMIYKVPSGTYVFESDI